MGILQRKINRNWQIIIILIFAVIIRFYGIDWGMPGYYGGDEFEHAQSSLQLLISPITSYLKNPYLF